MGKREAIARRLLIDSLDELIDAAESLYEPGELSSNELERVSEKISLFSEKLGVYKFAVSLKDGEAPLFDLEPVHDENEEPKQEPEVSQEPNVMAKVDEFEEAVAEDAEELDADDTGEAEVDLGMTSEDVEDIPEEVVPEENPQTEEIQVESDVDLPAESEEEPVVSDLVEESGNTEEPEIEEPEVQAEILEAVKDLGLDKGVEVNDTLAEEEDASLAGKLQRQPIQDLKSAIGLNQRFLFSNALFDGNMEAFNRTLNEVNHLEDLASAKKYLSVQIEERFGWDSESAEVKEFMDLVERRFM